MKRTKNILMYVSLVLLFTFGVALVFNKQIATFLLNAYRPKITRSIVDENKNKWKKEKIKELSPAEVLRNRLLNDKRAAYIGFVAVPEMDIMLPIVNEVTNYGLNVGAGAYYPDQAMGKGNYVLASHIWQPDRTSLFSPLYYHKNDGLHGQFIYLTDLTNVYKYKAIEYKTVPVTDNKYIQPNYGEGLVTLFTCNYTAELGRVVLQGKLIESKPVDKLTNEEYKSIFKVENGVK